MKRLISNSSVKQLGCLHQQPLPQLINHNNYSLQTNILFYLEFLVCQGTCRDERRSLHQKQKPRKITSSFEFIQQMLEVYCYLQTTIADSTPFLDITLRYLHIYIQKQHIPNNVKQFLAIYCKTDCKAYCRVKDTQSERKCVSVRVSKSSSGGSRTSLLKSLSFYWGLFQRQDLMETATVGPTEDQRGLTAAG